MEPGKAENQITLTITAGAGGEDAREWARMLARMYLGWLRRRGYEQELQNVATDESGEEKSATFRFHGDEGLNDLAGEMGVHKLVRISPFDKSGRRHTAFASVGIEGGDSEATEEQPFVRSYVLNPYQLVEDYRRGVKTDRARDVLGGDLDELFSHPVTRGGGEQVEGQPGTEDRIREVLRQIHEPHATRVLALRELAREELEHGYPREALLDDFERVRRALEAEQRDEEEDDVVAVMDALVGWCSPGAGL